MLSSYSQWERESPSIFLYWEGYELQEHSKEKPVSQLKPTYFLGEENLIIIFYFLYKYDGQNCPNQFAILVYIQRLIKCRLLHRSEVYPLLCGLWTIIQGAEFTKCIHSGGGCGVTLSKKTQIETKSYKNVR